MAGKTVLTVGSFDILHGEHIHLFNECRKLAGKKGKVVVGINSDLFIERRKGRPPVMPFGQRSIVVGNLRQVDDTYANTTDTIDPLIMACWPDYLVVGSDWAYPKDYLGEVGLDANYLYGVGCQLVFVASQGHTHSSDFRKKLEASE